MTVAMRWIMIGIVGVLGSIGAWQYLKHQHLVQAEAASLLYESALAAARLHDVLKVEALEQQLVNEHPKTPYAVLSALLAASMVPEKTIDYLQVAVNIDVKGSLVHIARVRLATALSGKGKLQEALTLLNSVKPPEAYIRLYEEAKGDIYVQDNQLEKAKVAYALALQATPTGIPTSWLELKQFDLSSDLSDTSSTKERS